VQPLLRRLTRAAFRRGVLQGSRPWLVTGVVVIGARIVGRMVRADPETAYREELAPGERVEIRVLPPAR
jgi:hypothetical protein